MNKIKFGLHIGNIMIYLTFTTSGGQGPPPHTPKIEILKVALEWPSPIQIHSLV